MFISTLKNDAGWADVRAQLGLSASMMEVLGLLLAQESILIEQSMHMPRGVHGSDWCELGQFRHQSVTYGLTNLESVTNPWLLKSNPIRSDPWRTGSDWINPFNPFSLMLKEKYQTCCKKIRHTS